MSFRFIFSGGAGGVRLCPGSMFSREDKWTPETGTRCSVSRRLELISKGLARNLKGEIPLSPPTVVTLHELLKFSTLGDLEKEIETRPWGQPLLPRLIPLPDGPLILEPWDPV